MQKETIDDNETTGGNDKKQAIPVPILDYEAYRTDWAELELSSEHENELLLILWDIMRTMCDLSLNMDSMSMVTDTILRSAFKNETDTQEQQEE